MTTFEFGGFDSPLFVGELRGYRLWQYGPEGTLKSITWANEWTATENVAKCFYQIGGGSFGGPHPDIKAPWRACDCGFYAFYTLDKLLASEYMLRSYPFVTSIVGTIAASGTIIPGTKGFRAEKARIEALVSLPGYFTEQYRSDIDFVDEARKLTEKYPPQDNPWVDLRRENRQKSTRLKTTLG